MPSFRAAQAASRAWPPATVAVHRNGPDPPGAQAHEALLDVAALDEQAGMVTEVVEADQTGDDVEHAAVVGGDDAGAELGGTATAVVLVAHEGGAEDPEEHGQPGEDLFGREPAPALRPCGGDRRSPSREPPNLRDELVGSSPEREGCSMSDSPAAALERWSPVDALRIVVSAVVLLVDRAGRPAVRRRPRLVHLRCAGRVPHHRRGRGAGHRRPGPDRHPGRARGRPGLGHAPGPLALPAHRRRRGRGGCTAGHAGRRPPGRQRTGGGDRRRVPRVPGPVRVPDRRRTGGHHGRGGRRRAVVRAAAASHRLGPRRPPRLRAGVHRAGVAADRGRPGLWRPGRRPGRCRAGHAEPSPHPRRRRRGPHPQRGGAGRPAPGVGRRPGVDALLRHDDRRLGPLREGARRRRAQGRPPLPPGPHGHAPGPRRRAALLVAASGRRARGLRGPGRVPRRRAHAAARRVRVGRAGWLRAGLRGHRRSLPRRRRPRRDHRRRPGRDLGADGDPAPPRHRPPRPASGQRVPGRGRRRVDDRLRVQRAGGLGPAPGHRPGRAGALPEPEGRCRAGGGRSRTRAWAPTRSRPRCTASTRSS